MNTGFFCDFPKKKTKQTKNPTHTLIQSEAHFKSEILKKIDTNSAMLVPEAT